MLYWTVRAIVQCTVHQASAFDAMIMLAWISGGIGQWRLARTRVWTQLVPDTVRMKLQRSTYEEARDGGQKDSIRRMKLQPRGS